MPVARVTEERTRRIDEAFPGGESYRRVVERMQSFLSDVAGDWDGCRIVVIGHSATRWALEHLLSGAPLEELVAAPFEWREGWVYVLPRDGV